MIIKKHTFHEEVWGAKFPVYEYEVEESYNGEVFELVLEEIKNGLDYVPEELEVEDRGNVCIIDPYEYLSDEEVEELEAEINKIWED